MVRMFRTSDGAIHEIQEPQDGCWIALTNPTATEIFEISVYQRCRAQYRAESRSDPAVGRLRSGCGLADHADFDDGYPHGGHKAPAAKLQVDAGRSAPARRAAGKE